MKRVKNTLTVSHLGKCFLRHRAVSDVSLLVYSGEVVGLLGPNGAGKTTCFGMIIGLVSCDSGSIQLNGVEISRLSMDQRSRRGLGYLPQEGSIFGALSVEDNIRAILQISPRIREQTIPHRLEFLLQAFHIEHLREHMGASLSGGERRRVEIARALATNPRFLLLDEPFAGVDPISVGDIQKIIRWLTSHDIGIIITDHNVRETLGICDRSYIISNGQVLVSGTVDEILCNTQVRDTYLGEDFRL